MTGPLVRGATAAALCSLFASIAGAAAPWDDELPWSFLDDGCAFRTAASRLDDSATGWNTTVLEIATVLSRGGGDVTYLRWPHVSFSAGEQRALTRWPDAAGEGASEGWPGEAQVAGWGRPAAGYLCRLRAPVLGPLACGAEIALPFAANALYPFAARSISLRLQARRRWPISEAFVLEAGGGRTLNTSAAGDLLAPAAFPGRGELTAGLSWRPAPDVEFGTSLTYGDGGRDSRCLRLALAWPIRDGIRLQAGWVHEYADPDDRLFRDGFSLGLSLPAITESTVAPDAAP